jgi:hypothetical protein
MMCARPSSSFNWDGTPPLASSFFVLAVKSGVGVCPFESVTVPNIEWKESPVILIMNSPTVEA